MARKLTAKQIAKIKKLHKQGLSDRKIAKQIKRARSTVWYQVQKIKGRI